MLEQFKRMPFGFYVCAMGFTFERLAFYTVKYLLAIWIATEVVSGGLGLTDVKAGTISGLFVAWTYITPMFGGYIADRWLSPRICVALGMILMGAGYICAWKATSLTMIYVMMILVAVGTGLFKGNLSGINALQFKSEKDLDSAFSIQYSFVNIGSFIGTTFLAITATTGLGPIHLSFNTVFLICGLFLLIDAAWFIVAGKTALGDLGKVPFKKDQREFVHDEKKELELNEPLTTGDKKKIFAIFLVTMFSVVFWMLWYMAYLPAYYHFGYGDGADFLNKANWYIGDFLVPSAWFDSVNALVCIILGPILAMLWNKLSLRPQGDMSMYRKTALGCGLLGVSYLVMVFADGIAMSKGQCSVLWLGLVCMLMSIGEMVFSPLGNSFINKLSPAKVLGLLLGFWPIAVFFAQLLYPAVYAWTKTQTFTFGYGLLAGIVIVFGAVLWVISGKLDAWAEEE
ncbi:MAG TPA: peptide MFS transporter [Mogibacterium sp.]|nr:peptide MFS transporter [Mogibacterium sp.]